jgi:hypothetical protein
MPRQRHSDAASVLGCSAPTAASIPCHCRVNARQTVPYSLDPLDSRCMGRPAVDPFLTVNCTHPSSCFSFFNDSSLIHWIQFTTHRSHWSQSGWCSKYWGPKLLSLVHSQVFFVSLNTAYTVNLNMVPCIGCVWIKQGFKQQMCV